MIRAPMYEKVYHSFATCGLPLTVDKSRKSMKPTHFEREATLQIHGIIFPN